MFLKLTPFGCFFILLHQVTLVYLVVLEILEIMDPKVNQADQDHKEALVLQVVNVLLLLLLSKKKNLLM